MTRPSDAHRLQQVFLNLFLNAADAMSSGGSLSLHLGARGSDAEEADMLRTREVEASYRSAQTFGFDELIDKVQPDGDRFPEFTRDVRAAMYREGTILVTTNNPNFRPKQILSW